MRGKDSWNEHLIAAGLLLLDFLLLFPAVVITAPGSGMTSAWGRTLPFLCDPVWQKYWSAGFIVVTLYGLALLEGISRRGFERADGSTASQGMGMGEYARSGGADRRRAADREPSRCRQDGYGRMVRAVGAARRAA